MEIFCFRDESEKLVKVIENETKNKNGTDVIPISAQFTLNTICGRPSNYQLNFKSNQTKFQRLQWE